MVADSNDDRHRLGESQLGVDYSDSTPDITYTYDWMGNPATVGDAEGTRTFAYNYTTSGHPGLVSVTTPGIVNHSLNYTYDALGRRTVMSLQDNSSPVFTNNYGYDATSGRLATIGDGTYSAHYTYQDGTGLLTQNQIKLDSTSAVVTTHNRTYDARTNNYHLLTTANNTGETTRTYTYEYNNKDQRTKLTLADGTYWEYSYDDKGQVTNGTKKDSAGNLIAGQYFGYSYDGIGNRVYAEEKLAALKLTYTTNNVNQYTQIDIPGVVPVLGEADADTTVKAVRTDSSNLTGGKQKTIPTRSGKYFSGALTGVDNTTAPQTITYDVYAIKDETTTQQVHKESSTYTVPKKAQTLTYDTDGNCTGIPELGITLTWNGENRMIEGQTATGKVEYAYDYMGRRISKKGYAGSTGNWTLVAHQKFVYNGYKQIAEYNAITASDVLQKTYTWQPVSLDVPLWVKDGANYYYYIVDGNKNVRAMVDTSGTEVAQYDYNPFGKVVTSGGAYKSTNPFRFSSEYHDDESGVIYYNYRYYSADLGRWLSRDPIEESGGIPLYGMVHNDAINNWDNWGLESADNYYKGNWNKFKKVWNGWDIVKSPTLFMFVDPKKDGIAFQHPEKQTKKILRKFAQYVYWGLLAKGYKEAATDFHYWYSQEGRPTDFGAVMQRWANDSKALKNHFDEVREIVADECKTAIKRKEKLFSTSGKDSRYHLYLGGYSIGYRTMKVSTKEVKVQFRINDKYDFSEGAKAYIVFMGIRVGVKDAVWIHLTDKKIAIAKDFKRECFWTEVICCKKKSKK